MTKRIRAILIDPADRAVREIWLLAGKDSGLDAIRWALGDDDITIDVANLGRHADLYFDDEGLLKLEEGRVYPFQEWPGRPPLAGRALLLDRDEQGDTISSPLDASVVSQIVQFSAREFFGMESGEEDVEHPVLGKIRSLYVRGKFGPHLTSTAPAPAIEV
jgi:hypothetical protein